MAETSVHTYRDRAEYEQDLERRARDGWVVTAVTEQYARPGCLGAILAVMWWRLAAARPRIVVTYERDDT